jgi:predicted dehydrogenase
VSALRVAISGSGMRSRSVWQRHVIDLDGLELVGVQDVSRESLAKAVEAGTLAEERAYLELDEMLAETRPDVLLVCPVQDTHAEVAIAALEAGCHVLVEKPLATSLVDAVSVVRVAAERGLRLGVVQNWRTKAVGRRLREAIASGAVGQVSHVFFRYLRDRELPHLPDYLFDEDDPLLYAMTIHHVDLFRFALGQEIAHVEVRGAHPPWSRYRDPSVLQAWLETEGGVAVSYVATFSSRNAHLPQESLQVEGELGTLHNESAYFEPPLLLSRRGDSEPVDLTADEVVRDVSGQYVLADLAVLSNFRDAVLHGESLISPGEENLGTLATIEAAARSRREGRSFDPRELLAEARAAAPSTPRS